MTYEWDKNLESGNDLIDNQHKQLFAALNKLVLAYQLGSGPEKLNETIEFLIAYTLKHFQDEESLMEEFSHTDKAVHKNYHNEFKRTVGDLSQRLAKEGYNNALMESTIKIMADWLINHIKSDDFKLAAHIQSCRSKEKK